ncbi:MAG: YHS domain-containing protein, partial [Fimbriimonadaceae bacterium]|nr:YHS domain-containing protein [Fimbriimonadaceae bacterium]
MITALALAVSLQTLQAEPPLLCGVMGSPTKATSPAEMIAGIRFPVCCPGCDTKLKNEPAKYLKAAVESGRTIGEFLFDPVSGSRIKDSKVYADHKGIRYRFASEANLKTFQTEPARFATAPAKETLTCPVMGVKVADYSKAGGFVDHNGVRMFICCPGCLGKLKSEPAKFAASAKDIK